jgi:hypothetical protein
LSNPGKWVAGACATLLGLCLIAGIANPGAESCWPSRYYNDDIVGYLFCRFGNWVHTGSAAAVLAGLIALGAIIVIYRALFGTATKHAD